MTRLRPRWRSTRSSRLSLLSPADRVPAWRLFLKLGAEWQPWQRNVPVACLGHPTAFPAAEFETPKSSSGPSQSGRAPTAVRERRRSLNDHDGRIPVLDIARA